MAYKVTFELANGTTAKAFTVAEDDATAEFQAAHKVRNLYGEPVRVISIEVMEG
jgi:hypothetical protein